ncbi:MAG: helix-turn-helix domain-containing protein [Thermoproteota archaeon]|jgi:DNA-binding transcriptional ArsR family regulator|nr:helix-turn-helix domain-containing protein [Thermoproteota archaeon]HYY51139.1 helix-turn-helix domain-containing protein [Nitrososphaeraceae archaeon]
MKAVYIIDDVKIAKILVDPMRRAILDLLRQKPMTQAGLANELGLTAASLNHHIKILRSNKLVTIFKREVERHRIMQIFFSSVAYLFIYDLDSLPKNVARYFYPVSLERARALASLLLLYDKKLSLAYKIKNTPEAINYISESLSRQLVIAAKSYENRIINHGDERYVYEIYGKAVTNLLKEDKKQIPSIERKNSFLRVQNKRHKPILSWF